MCGTTVTERPADQLPRSDTTLGYRVGQIFCSPQLRELVASMGRRLVATRDPDARIYELAEARFLQAYGDEPRAQAAAKHSVGILYIARDGVWGDVEMRYRDSFPPTARAPVTALLCQANQALLQIEKRGGALPAITSQENQVLEDLQSELQKLGLELRFVKSRRAYTVGILVEKHAEMPAALPAMQIQSGADNNNLVRQGQVGLIRGGAQLASRRDTCLEREP